MGKLRILYAAGPGDVIGTYRCWLRGEDDPSVPDVAYSRQFLDVCRQVGADGWIISANPKVADVQEGPFRLEHRPIPFEGRSGLAYHVGRTLYTLGLVRSAIKMRADVAVIMQHGVSWFALSVLPLFGTKVVPAVHNTLWLAAAPDPSLSEKVLLRLARPLFAAQSLAILSHPGTCARQVEELTHGKNRPIEAFIPLYRPSTFAGLPEQNPNRKPFRVMFAGRIEIEKGVLDLLEIAAQLTARGRTDIEFDICGTGSALEQLRQATREAGLEARFRCHGRLEMKEFREMFGNAHVVVVPTRMEYTEGFNAVVAEAILSGRPVITSNLCPAVELVSDAVVEVRAEALDQYRDAILRLCDDFEFYESKRRACLELKAQFFEWERSWGGGLGRILNGLAERSAAKAVGRVAAAPNDQP